ncbi:hypothetical protein HDE_05581 [Halotydeus destructor]|nr:hypothetical protein HDE_05581 [Halotydeus destructor]
MSRPEPDWPPMLSSRAARPDADRPRRDEARSSSGNGGRATSQRPTDGRPNRPPSNFASKPSEASRNHYSGLKQPSAPDRKREPERSDRGYKPIAAEKRKSSEQHPVDEKRRRLMKEEEREDESEILLFP